MGFLLIISPSPVKVKGIKQSQNIFRFARVCLRKKAKKPLTAAGQRAIIKENTFREDSAMKKIENVI
jgi:hypothetical protein